MFVSADTMALLVDSGVSAEKLVEIIRAIERDVESVRPVAAARSANAERQARFRQRRRGEPEADTVTRNVTDNATQVTQKVSPTPPSKKAPSSAPKGASSPPTSADAIAEQVWETATPASRNRSGRPQTRRAVAAALAKGASPPSLLASVRDHCRKSGDHAKGLHRIIEAELWREHRPRPEPPSQTMTPEYRRHCEAHWRSTGEWKPEWGEKPRQAA